MFFLYVYCNNPHVKFSMDTTLFFIKFFGYFYFIIGFAMLLNPKRYRDIATLTKRSLHSIIIGIITLLMCIPIVILHNNWECSVVGLVTFFGWAGILKGFMLIAFPKFIEKRGDIIRDWSDFKLRIIGGICVVLGGALMYCGYYPYWM